MVMPYEAVLPLNADSVGADAHRFIGLLNPMLLGPIKLHPVAAPLAEVPLPCSFGNMHEVTCSLEVVLIPCFRKRCKKTMSNVAESAVTENLPCFTLV